MIGLTVEKAHGEYDPGTSKFLGSPTMPEEWLTDGTVGDDDFFFAQLRIAEFKGFADAALLPGKGFIYFFLSETDDGFKPNVKFFDGEPDTLIDDFNAGFEILGDDADTDYSADFTEADDYADGTRILVDDGDDIILLQYDPLDDGMPEFLAETEKLVRFRIKKDELAKLDFSNVTFSIE